MSVALELPVLCTVDEVEHLLWLQRRAWARGLGLGADADLHALPPVPRGIA